MTVNRAESLLSVFFTETAGAAVDDFSRAAATDHARYARFFHHMLERGVYLPPSGYEMWTLSTTHGPDELELAVGAASKFRG